MIKWGVQKIKNDRAWFSATLFNSQGPKEDDTPWQMSDFLEEEEEEVHTEEDTQKRIAIECEKWRTWANNCIKGG
jgi:hypothetical protein